MHLQWQPVPRSTLFRNDILRVTCLCVARQPDYISLQLSCMADRSHFIVRHYRGHHGSRMNIVLKFKVFIKKQIFFNTTE